MFPDTATSNITSELKALRTLRDKKGRVLSVKNIGSIAALEKQEAKKPKLQEESAVVADRPSSARSG